MIVYLIGFPLLMLTAVIDSSVLVELRYLEGQPGLTLIMVVSWAMLNELSDGLVWAFIGGLFVDTLSVVPPGTSSFAFCVIVILISNSLGQVSRRNLALPLLAIAGATLIHHGVIMGMLTVMGSPVSISGALLRWTLPSIIYNAIFILVVFRVMGAIIEFFRPARVVL